jgi:hypothetical protein
MYPTTKHPSFHLHRALSSSETKQHPLEIHLYSWPTCSTHPWQTIGSWNLKTSTTKQQLKLTHVSQYLNIDITTITTPSKLLSLSFTSCLHSLHLSSIPMFTHSRQRKMLYTNCGLMSLLHHDYRKHTHRQSCNWSNKKQYNSITSN